ncbi:MAG: hypothetical protein ABIE03_07090 [Patescibacteria group bacterium]|nr:hypothetical protein [Patescibacteria group bacterium]
MKKIVPDSFTVPIEFKSGEYLIRQIRKENNPKDFAAVIANSKLIDKIRGGKLCHTNWPPPDFTLDDNLKDVQSFEKQARDKTSFTYVIWDKHEESYLGCIYIFSIEKMYPELKDKYDIDFSMWVVQDIYEAGKYPEVYKQVWEWIKNDWPFDPKRVFHRNSEKTGNM